MREAQISRRGFFSPKTALTSGIITKPVRAKIKPPKKVKFDNGAEMLTLKGI